LIVSSESMVGCASFYLARAARTANQLEPLAVAITSLGEI